jgi:hypothetical protein
MCNNTISKQSRVIHEAVASALKSVEDSSQCVAFNHATVNSVSVRTTVTNRGEFVARARVKVSCAFYGSATTERI